MSANIMDQVLEIYHQIKQDEAYRCVWETFAQCNDHLWEWMDTLPEEQYTLLDDYIGAFFAVHMQMMEIALMKK